MKHFTLLLFFLSVLGCHIVHSQVYQHNFNDISDIPTEAQLATPNVIASGITATWFDGKGTKDFIARGPVSNRGLSLSNITTPYVLDMKVEGCKKLDITRISFRAYAFNTSYFNVKINGNYYGSGVSAGRAFVSFIHSQPLNDLMGDVRIEVEVSSTGYPNYNYFAIDDFTINGNVSDLSVPQLGTLTFSPYAKTELCQQYAVLNFEAKVSTYYKTLDYSLDPTSVANGVKISPKGYVTFPTDFSGLTSITANVTGCLNETTSKTHEILIKPGGLFDVETDFDFRFGFGGSAYIGTGCYFAGQAFNIAVNAADLKGKVRFKDGVRHYEFSAQSPFAKNNTEITLYYRQADFDNYRGGNILPKHGTDAKGKENLLIKLIYDGPESIDIPELIIDPWDSSIEWDANQKRWAIPFVLPLGFDSNTQIFLSDAGSSLPVKLETIAARKSVEGNQISWRTSEESGFSHFEVERSADPRAGFNYLATVQSDGNSLGSSYRFTDIGQTSETLYYRLKMVDLDESFEYSKIVSVVESKIQNQLSVYPNPVTDNMLLESSENIESVRLLTPKGTEVFTNHMNQPGGAVKIALPNLTPGMYYLNVNPGTLTEKTKRVLIK